MVWAGYRATLNHLVLSVLDGIDRSVPASLLVFIVKTQLVQFLVFLLYI
jgi:hypothetical protein